LAPDGTMSADELIDPITAGDQRRAALFSLPDDNLTYTYSVFLHEGTVATCAFGGEILGGSGLVQTSMRLDLSSGTITRAPNATAYGIETFPNGWYRVWLAITNTNTQNDYGVISVWGDLDNELQTGSVFGWGAQVELGAAPSSYIPADTGPTPRAADVVRTVDTEWLESGRGTVRVTADVAYEDAQAATPTSRAATCLFAGAERTCIGRSSAGMAVLATGDDDLALDTGGLVGGSWPVATRTTVIAAWESTSATLWAGAPVGAPLTIPTIFDEVRIGNPPSLGGHVTRFVYWPYRIADVDLAEAASP
jgi:hypothetical protein